jgi:2-polyprenyl-6-methoxyphenol hydroxylase-like FAD-dependent oxidoreductase
MKTPNKTVLICGSSIAGPALAFWLNRRGFVTTVVERAPALRSGGQAIDVRGVALDVVERMGLLDEVSALRTRLRGMSILDSDGREIERSEERTLSGGRFDSGDIELFRDDLADLFHKATRDKTDYVFGDTIAALDDQDAGIHVTFASGRRQEFDLVVGADGLRSAVRRLVFGNDAPFLRHLGAHLAIFSTPNSLGLQDWQLSFGNEKGGCLVFPTRDNAELRVFIGFATDHPDIGRLDLAQQKQWVAERCGWMGEPVSTLLQGLAAAPDLYLGPIAQIHMPCWSKGRVALVGDAAYCASPKSGQGTSLAIVGAYVLAEELAKDVDDHRSALQAYERRMRPFVDINQALATDNPEGRPADDALDRAKRAIVLDE